MLASVTQVLVNISGPSFQGFTVVFFVLFFWHPFQNWVKRQLQLTKKLKKMENIPQKNKKVFHGCVAVLFTFSCLKLHDNVPHWFFFFFSFFNGLISFYFSHAGAVQFRWNTGCFHFYVLFFKSSVCEVRWKVELIWSVRAQSRRVLSSLFFFFFYV